VWIFSKTDVLQQFGWMPADLTLSGVCGFTFAVELNKRAYQNRGLFPWGAVITFERRFRLACHIGPAGRQFRIAEALRAPSSVCEIRDAFQIATAAVPAEIARDDRSDSQIT